MNFYSIISKLWKQMRKILLPSQIRWGMLVLLLSLCGAIAETLGVSVMLPFVEVMLEPEKILNLPRINSICLKLDVNLDNLGVIIAGLVILVYLAKNILLCFLSWARIKYSTEIQRELSVRMLNLYACRGYPFFKQTNTATLMRGTNGSVAGINIVIQSFMKIVADILTILCIITFMICTDWKMAISLIAMVGGCLLLVVVLFKGIANEAGQVYHEYTKLVSKWSLQFFAGIKEILVLKRKDFFINNYESSFEQRKKAQIKQTVTSEIPAYIIEGICVVGIIIVVCMRISGMENPSDFIPQLAVYAVGAFRILPSIGRISANFNLCVFNLPAVGEVYENISAVEQFGKDFSEEVYSETKKAEFRKEIFIKDVSFKYEDGDQYILNHISLKINKGESVAFVGPSGAGKSTLADIILGLYKIKEGKILIDEKDISANRSIRGKMIGFVPQSVYLIDDTVRRNIAFGIADEDIKDEIVWKVLEKAQLKDFVNSLKEGLNTIVGERGVRFSGGQMQRLAIARALYNNPDILVLDEATSALDNETENAVMEAIDALQGELTLIIIAHRLTTIRNCQKIYEIRDGMAIERKYEELV